jgi:uncharacterized integral membrane protein
MTEYTNSKPPAGRSAVPRSRMGGLWVAAVVFAFVLLLLLLFVLQNGQRAEVSLFGARGHLPMGVALLLAAVCGILLVALPGMARIAQLRILGHRRGAHHTGTRPAAGPLPSSSDDASDQQDAPLATGSSAGRSTRPAEFGKRIPESDRIPGSAADPAA